MEVKPGVVGKALMLAELKEWLDNEGIIDANKSNRYGTTYMIQCTEEYFNEISEGREITCIPKWGKDYERQSFIHGQVYFFTLVFKPYNERKKEFDGRGLA